MSDNRLGIFSFCLLISVYTKITWSRYHSDPKYLITIYNNGLVKVTISIATTLYHFCPTSKSVPNFKKVLTMQQPRLEYGFHRLNHLVSQPVRSDDIPFWNVYMNPIHPPAISGGDEYDAEVSNMQSPSKFFKKSCLLKLGFHLKKNLFLKLPDALNS